MPADPAFPQFPAFPAAGQPPPPPTGTHHRLLRLCEPLNVNITREKVGRTAYTPGIKAADLITDPDALAAVVGGESDRILAAHGRRPRHDVAASRLLHHYLWSVCLLFSGPWYLERRVPSIPLEAVSIDPAAGVLTLDEDQVGWPAGAERGDTLRAAVAAHVGPLLEAFAPLVRRGPRALWGMVTDDLASGLWTLGRCLGEEERGVREAAAVLPGATSPFPGAADFRLLRTTDGRRHPTRTRLGCCLHYAITPEDPCATCPRTTDEERLRRLESA